MSTAGTHRTAGFVNVKTESWSSKDGIGRRSEKSKSWGPGIEYINFQILYTSYFFISEGMPQNATSLVQSIFLSFHSNGCQFQFQFQQQKSQNIC